MKCLRMDRTMSMNRIKEVGNREWNNEQSINNGLYTEWHNNGVQLQVGTVENKRRTRKAGKLERITTTRPIRTEWEQSPRHQAGSNGLINKITTQNNRTLD